MDKRHFDRLWREFSIDLSPQKSKWQLRAFAFLTNNPQGAASISAAGATK
jgi:hypothetical protein